MAVNAGWSYPGCEDGWVKAHNAIRADMGALSVALASCLDDLKKGKALQAWRIANLQAWWAIFTENVHVSTSSRTACHTHCSIHHRMLAHCCSLCV